MADDELTEMHEGFEQTLRTMLMAASKIRERAAERRAETARNQQRAANQTEQVATRGYTVNHKALAAELAPVHHDQWWTQASPTRIARLWELSTRFADDHPDAAAARDQLRQQMQQRYGIDPEQTRAGNHDLTNAIKAIADDDKQHSPQVHQQHPQPGTTAQATNEGHRVRPQSGSLLDKTQSELMEAEFAPVQDRHWWNQKGPEEMAQRWERATQFSDQNKHAQQARETMRSTFQNRYGIDLETLKHEGRDLTTAIAAVLADDKQGSQTDTAAADQPQEVAAEQFRTAAQQPTTLTVDQEARATAALDAWFTNPGGPVPWEPPAHPREQIEGMHAALEAPTLDDAMAAFPGPIEETLTTPDEEARTRRDMSELREQLRAAEPGSETNTAAATLSEGAYQRSRHSDMPTADPADRTTRTTVAESFPHPTGELTHSNTSGRSQATQTQHRPQQKQKQPKLSR